MDYFRSREPPRRPCSISRVLHGLFANPIVRTDRIDRVHTASLSSTIIEASSTLPGDVSRRGIFHRQAPGTASRTSKPMLGDPSIRTNYITKSATLLHDTRQGHAKRHGPYPVVGAKAVHCTLECEWTSGVRLLRSIGVRALVVTVDDARAVNSHSSTSAQTKLPSRISTSTSDVALPRKLSPP